MIHWTLFAAALAVLAGSVVALIRMRRSLDAALDWGMRRVDEARQRENAARAEAKEARQQAKRLIAELLRMKKEGWERQPAEVDEPLRAWTIDNKHEVAVSRARRAQREREQQATASAPASLAREIADDLASMADDPD